MSVHMPPDLGRVEMIAEEVTAELRAACLRFAPMHSAHEGWAVIREEMDELWEEVRRKDTDLLAMRKEAIQVAAMAQRFVLDLVPVEPERGRQDRTDAALARLEETS